MKPLFGLHQILHSTIPRYLPLLVLEPEEPYSRLLDASSALTAAFDSAIEAMYPDQDEEEVDSAVSSLGRRSLGLIKTFRDRLDRAIGDEDRRSQCATFLTKWEDRLQKEQGAWSERALSVSSLKHALPQ